MSGCRELGEDGRVVGMCGFCWRDRNSLLAVVMWGVGSSAFSSQVV